MTGTTIPVLDDIDLAELERDPYPVYARLRREAPIAYVPAIDEWLVTRWDDCNAIAERTDAFMGGHPIDDVFFGPYNILRMEGEDHTNMRVGIDARLRPRVVKSYLDPMARPIVIDYIERIRDAGQADLATELFEKISVRVIGNSLGLGEMDDETLVRWFHVLGGGRANETGDPEADRLSAEAVAEIDAFLTDKVARYRDEPDDSVISHMVHGGATNGPRTYEEISPSINVIILGGFQEPGNAVSNSFHGLMEDPEQLRALQEDPAGLAVAAVQEGLRWIAPIGQVSRTLLKDVEHDGAVIPTGAKLALLVASANRDESRFPNPEAFDLFRPFLPNATFGYGHHFCAGHHLARALAQITVEETARRLPGLRRDPDGQAEVRGYLFRGVKSLPALWD